jgi:hypothetical protein
MAGRLCCIFDDTTSSSSWEKMIYFVDILTKMQKVGFEPTPFRNRALIYRLRPLGHFCFAESLGIILLKWPPSKAHIYAKTQDTKYIN